VRSLHVVALPDGFTQECSCPFTDLAVVVGNNGSDYFGDSEMPTTPSNYPPGVSGNEPQITGEPESPELPSAFGHVVTFKRNGEWENVYSGVLYSTYADAEKLTVATFDIWNADGREHLSVIVVEFAPLPF
jgi:hypothetical protein